jgi:hypothetical protein
MITGSSTSGATGTPVTRLYRNDGNGVFTSVPHPFPNVYFGSSMAWGDYDNDGALDVAIAGVNDVGILVAGIWHNDGVGHFTDIGANLPGMDLGILAWGDYDNDGDLDVMITGYDTVSALRRSILYRNDGGTFVDSGNTFRNVYLGIASWVDYDSDGKLDLSIAGNELGGDIFFLYRNNNAIANSVPAAPTNLAANFNGTNVDLSWSAASDGQTQAPASPRDSAP